MRTHFTPASWDKTGHLVVVLVGAVVDGALRDDDRIARERTAPERATKAELIAGRGDAAADTDASQIAAAGGRDRQVALTHDGAQAESIRATRG